MPQRGSMRVQQLIKNAQINVLISKIITSIFIVVFGGTVFFPLAVGGQFNSASTELAIASGISAFLVVVFFVIVLMGLQVSTSFVSSKTPDVLNPLPLSKREISTIIFVCFVRIFDLPLATAIITLSAAYVIAGGSILGTIVALAAVIVTEIFALAATVGLSRIFFSRIASGGGRSRLKAILRFVFIIIWLVPTFGAYFLLNYGVTIVHSFTSVTQILTSTGQILLLIYPFSYGFLVTFATNSGMNFNLYSLIVTIAASGVYLALAVRSLGWLVGSIRKLGTTGLIKATREVVSDTTIHPRPPVLGIIRKDVRVASRSPSFASLFFLPAVEAIVLALSLNSFDSGVASALGILAVVSFVTTFIPPMLFSIEGIASSYTRTLPISRRALIASKTIFAAFTYFLSLIILLVLALYFAKDPFYMLAYGGLQAASVTAACILELVILVRKFWKEGGAIGNLYQKMSTWITIVLPGIIVAYLPLGIAIMAISIRASLVLPIFAMSAGLELLVMIMAAWRQGH